MDPSDETRTLRRRLAATQQAVAAQAPPTQVGGVALVARTVAVAAYPTVAQAYYAMKPLRIAGAIGEGVVPNFVEGTKVFYALNVGTTVPDEGTAVVVSGSGGRFTFTWNW